MKSMLTPRRLIDTFNSEITSITAIATMSTDAPEPSMQLLAEAAQNESRILKDGSAEPMDHDDGSSSLSELEDRPATEGTENHNEKSSPVSEDEEDTEAETERLEESPYKL